MLVLTRKAGESVRIGDDVEVIITAIEQNKVKIGIRSPRHIPIYREELYQKILQENRHAVGMDTGDMDLLVDLFPKKTDAAVRKRSSLAGGKVPGSEKSETAQQDSLG
ncbi:MAG: carbon storage regulator CsrA [Desulforhabdus sp.]|jgi:carbon storage regulator|nr:carbon storage regulator CsrA [Desulforhabdus sp.]